MPGIDPGASRMQSERSTKWATSPCFCWTELLKSRLNRTTRRRRIELFCMMDRWGTRHMLAIDRRESKEKWLCSLLRSTRNWISLIHECLNIYIGTERNAHWWTSGHVVRSTTRLVCCRWRTASWALYNTIWTTMKNSFIVFSCARHDWSCLAMWFSIFISRTKSVSRDFISENEACSCL